MCAAGHRSLAQSRVAGALDTLKTDAAQKVSSVKDTVQGLTPASKAQLADVAYGVGVLEHRVDWLGQACLCRRAAGFLPPRESPRAGRGWYAANLRPAGNTLRVCVADPRAPRNRNPLEGVVAHQG